MAFRHRHLSAADYAQEQLGIRTFSARGKKNFFPQKSFLLQITLFFKKTVFLQIFM